MAKENIITINDVEYSVDDFTDQQKVMLNHIQDLDRKLSNAQFNLDQLNVGREAFVNMLAASLQDGKEAQSEEG